MNVNSILKEKGGIHLDLGCGKNKQRGYVGMDIRPWAEVDIVHDMEVYPWPLPDECALTILCSHIVEHINPLKGGFLRFMDECWRVMKPDGQLIIVTPYAGSPGYFQDPTHVNPCNEFTWAYFDPLESHIGPQLYNFYEPKPWRIDVNHLYFSQDANLEVILVKRRDDASYHAKEECDG